ncbi:MAG: hypothetical protein ACRD0P_06935 [Stackebrandtia sp.]
MRLLQQDCTIEQVADEIRSRWQFSPLAAHRYAANLTQSAAAAAYNAITEDASASMDASLLSKLEQWPAPSGKPPTIYNLAVLALVYRTKPDRLVSAADLANLPARDHIALKGITTSTASSTKAAEGNPRPDLLTMPIGRQAANPKRSVRSISSPLKAGSALQPLSRVSGIPTELPDVAQHEQPDLPHVGLLQFVVVEKQRHAMDCALAAGTVTPAWMELIEEGVAQHRRDYIREAPQCILRTVVQDFARIRTLLENRQTTHMQERLCTAAAQLSTLAADALMKLGAIADARAWYRTARLAADETTNRSLRAHVRAQASMLPYYYGDPAETIRLATEAAALVSECACVAGVLAAAAEARAAARLGDARRAESAVEVAKHVFDCFEDEDPVDAFRFPYRRLLLYLSGALSHVGDPSRAERVHTEALEAYATAPDDFVIDPALIQLDRAATLARANHLDDACQAAIEAITQVSDEHRTDILLKRGRDILRSVPTSERRRPRAQDLRSILDPSL